MDRLGLLTPRCRLGPQFFQFMCIEDLPVLSLVSKEWLRAFHLSRHLLFFERETDLKEVSALNLSFNFYLTTTRLHNSWSGHFNPVSSPFSSPSTPRPYCVHCANLISSFNSRFKRSVIPFLDTLSKEGFYDVALQYVATF